ncbi:hypothetical protein RRG08_040994 [Elysia crispata]|uniref:Uncharacterized protein n=1 Tax=Elysia crispata TaxID=231223 RepID=A0AAE1DGV7_9GAST|nr:hypothetical protein RRG08_040994 [Elysia crispata]
METEWSVSYGPIVNMKRLTGDLNAKVQRAEKKDSLLLPKHHNEERQEELTQLNQDTSFKQPLSQSSAETSHRPPTCVHGDSQLRFKKLDLESTTQSRNEGNI